MKHATLVDLLSVIIMKTDQHKELTPAEKFLYLIYVDGIKEHDARDLVQGWYNVKHFSAHSNNVRIKKWDLIF